jgi:adenylate cyclase
MPGGRVLAMLAPYRGGAVAAVLVVALAVPGSLEWLEYRALNRLFESRGARQPIAPIVIVAIDESAFAEIAEQWPFARATHAKLVRRLAAGRPLAIGFDVIFDQPSSRGPADDAELGQAIAEAGNVVLGAAPSSDLLVHPGLKTATVLEVPNVPIAVLRDGAAGVGAINQARDSDNHVRRVYRRVWAGTQPMRGLDVELYRVASGAGLKAAPLPDADEILINFNGPPRTFPWVSYAQVLRDENVKPELFRDKIVLIGPTGELFHDLFPTPFSGGESLMPGVEIHANVLETYIRGNRLREVPGVVSTTLAGLAALVGAVLVVRLHGARALGAVVVLWALLVLAAYLAFVGADVWLRGVVVTLGLGLGYGLTLVDTFVREQRERRRLSQFFSPEVLREVVRHRHEHSLGSSRRLVTVLFADIRDFTALAEKLPPEDVAEMLREYLSEMTEVIFKHGGTVDKYIGDCVMALYNVPFEDPDHVMNALRTALELQERTLQVAARWEARLGTSIRSGIGINTGEAVVGTLGSRQRLEYTAIGDAINLGSRLEALTKQYGVAIIISEFTQQRLQGDVLTRELGQVTVRGRTQPVKVYGVLPADIRKHPRAVLDVAATLVLLGAGQTCLVTTRDVSEGGMALGGVPASWPVGTRVEIRCEGGLLPRPLLTEGTIAWRREDEAGISFAPLDPDAGPTVAEYVARRKRR